MAKTGAPPPWLKHVNKVIMLLNRWGFPIEHGAVLTVAGRRTGAPRRVPVSVMRRDGQRYLLAGPACIPKGAKIMLDSGVVPDVTPESFAALTGRCAVFRIEAP